MLSYSTNLCGITTLLLWACGKLCKDFFYLLPLWFCWHDQDSTSASLSRTLYPCWDWRYPNTRWAWLGPWSSSSFQHPSLPYWVHSLNGRMTWNPYTSHLEHFLSPSCPRLCLPGWVGLVWVCTVACSMCLFIALLWTLSSQLDEESSSVRVCSLYWFPRAAIRSTVGCMA